jgi:hypothetical protein|tara:strand:- start:1738 stop:2505 length:768 start_codon:yes stop_codon:yes gene_type:complete
MAEEGSDTGGEETGGGENLAERPSHVDEKFWNSDTGTVNTEAWSKSYNEMGKQIRTKSSSMEKDLRASMESERFANRPETSSEYTTDLPDGVEMPEGREWGFAEDDPMVTWLRDSIHEQGGDQEAFDDALIGYMNAKIDSEPDFQEQVDALGDYGAERVQRVEGFIQNMLSEELQEVVFEESKSSDMIKVFEEIMTKMGEPNFTPQEFGVEGDVATGLAELREMQLDPRYLTDKKYTKEIDDGYVRLYGNGMTAV